MLRISFLEECIVSIDAMECQQEIAKAIVGKKANFIVAVKNNQKELCQGIEEVFRFEQKHIRRAIKVRYTYVLMVHIMENFPLYLFISFFERY